MSLSFDSNLVENTAPQTRDFARKRQRQFVDLTQSDDEDASRPRKTYRPDPVDLTLDDDDKHNDAGDSMTLDESPRLSIGISMLTGHAKSAPGASTHDLPPDISRAPLRSGRLIETSVPVNFLSMRWWYKNRPLEAKAPCILHSQLVPKNMVEHLMVKKKDRAHGVKFETVNQKNLKMKGKSKSAKKHGPDHITNMEGAMHHFVTPIVETIMLGDYVYHTGGLTRCHNMAMYSATADKPRMGRLVYLSALVQQDFRDNQIMANLAGLRQKTTVGMSELPKMLTVSEKQQLHLRHVYDQAIRLYLIKNLTSAGTLPSVDGVEPMSLPTAVSILSTMIMETAAEHLPLAIQGLFVTHYGYIKGDKQSIPTVFSLEILFNTALHQIHNELQHFEQRCVDQGYNYTWDPPVIFTYWFGESETDKSPTQFMSRIHCAALKHYAFTHKLLNMNLFAWNDFKDDKILDLVKVTLSSQPHIIVMSKARLFSGTYNVVQEDTGTLDRKGKKMSNTGPTISARAGIYTPPKGTEDASLVIHNNSDGFGQNIESEGKFWGGSLDGMIGIKSSAAASLGRDRPDLCDHILQTPAI